MEFRVRPSNGFKAYVVCIERSFFYPRVKDQELPSYVKIRKLKLNVSPYGNAATFRSEHGI